MTRFARRRGLIGTGAAVIFAATIAAPAAAVWTNTVVDTTWFLAQPSLDVDSADHTDIAYVRAGDSPGVFYATNATGGWVSTRVTTGIDIWPSLATDAGAHPHVGFARRTGTTGIYLTENTTGSWTAPVLAAADLDPRSPSVDVNAAGKVGIVYASNYSFAPGIYYATNATGSWVKTRILAATWGASPYLRFDANGFAHIMYTRLDDEGGGLYYATNKTGSWVTTLAASQRGDSVEFAFDGAGKIHAAYRTLDDGPQWRVLYLTNVTGPWTYAFLPPSDGQTFFGPTTMGIEPVGGEVHIFTTIYPMTASDPPSRVVHYVTSSGVCCNTSGDVPDDGAPMREDSSPSLGFKSDGTLQLAFARIYPTAGLRFFSFGAASSLIASGSLVYAGTSIDLSGTGVRNIAYDRMDGSTGTTMFATGAGASWATVTAGTGAGTRVATDIATDAAGKVRIVDGVNYFSNATGSFSSDLTLPFGSDAEVEVDGSAHAHVLVSTPLPPYWQMDYRTNASGSWVSDSPMPATTFDDDTQGALALDAAGKPHIAWIFPSGGSSWGLAYQNRVSGSWTSYTLVDSGVNQRPSIAVDVAGKVHIAYIHYGTSPGIWYATNKSGSWVKTRLTRSYSDGAPSIALDAAGHVYVATTRAAQAATPGIYVMTNTTGTWVVTRVVATEAAGEVSLSVTSAGLARFSYDSNVAVHEYENSTTTLSAAASPTFADATFAEMLRGQLAGQAFARASKAGAAQSAGDGPIPNRGAYLTGPGTSVRIPHFGASAP